MDSTSFGRKLVATESSYKKTCDDIETVLQFALPEEKKVNAPNYYSKFLEGSEEECKIGLYCIGQLTTAPMDRMTDLWYRARSLWKDIVAIKKQLDEFGPGSQSQLSNLPTASTSVSNALVSRTAAPSVSIASFTFPPHNHRQHPMAPLPCWAKFELFLGKTEEQLANPDLDLDLDLDGVNSDLDAVNSAVKAISIERLIQDWAKEFRNQPTQKPPEHNNGVPKDKQWPPFLRIAYSKLDERFCNYKADLKGRSWNKKLATATRNRRTAVGTRKKKSANEETMNPRPQQPTAASPALSSSGSRGGGGGGK